MPERDRSLTLQQIPEEKKRFGFEVLTSMLLQSTLGTGDAAPSAPGLEFLCSERGRWSGDSIMHGQSIHESMAE
jgi:hypothetical protein